MMSTNEIIPFLKYVEPDNYIYCDTCKSVIWFNILIPGDDVTITSSNYVENDCDSSI